MTTINKILIDNIDYDILGNELTKVTYAYLKALRDNGELSEGHLYRITDYVTTTTQSSTKSAGNVFDVIVLATSTNELSHIARAIQHEGDTYFDENDLCAWELWYDLDNDTTKYEWADKTNGKGVIYRMIDEKRNDCPYDFKNILFYNEKLKIYTTSDKYYYTFSYVVSGKLYDGTVEKQAKYCYSNSIGAYIKNKKKSLNQNVFSNGFFDSYCHSNTFGNCCYSNTFSTGCHSNTFGNYCYDNLFGHYCYQNTFGNSCSYNTFGHNSVYNTFGNQCSDNTFGDNTENRKMDPNKTSITINDEYYDDGSGQVVPIKHPDLSTLPSILPYKFMGQYVYEQLIPYDFSQSVTYVHYPLRELGLAVEKPVLLQVNAFNYGTVNGKFQSSIRTGEYSVYITIKGDKYTIMHHRVTNTAVPNMYYRDDGPGYIHVVYSSLPESEGNNYYGY